MTEMKNGIRKPKTEQYFPYCHTVGMIMTEVSHAFLNRKKHDRPINEIPCCT